jgi:formate hydrogenlyase subunit 3/multisubunit Na+/H+ antiporter MnhD subunit
LRFGGTEALLLLLFGLVSVLLVLFAMVTSQTHFSRLQHCLPLVSFFLCGAAHFFVAGDKNLAFWSREALASENAMYRFERFGT